MQRIEIENFGPITHAEIDIAKIVVLIGEQASGKSTTAKLIYFFKSLKQDFFTFIFQEQKEYESYEFNFSNKIRSKFNLFFPFVDNLDSFSVKYYYSNDNTIEISKKKDENKSTVTYQGIRNVELLKEIISKIHYQETENVKYTEINSKEYSRYIGTKLLGDYIEHFYKDKLPTVYVPAGRNITVSYSGQFKLLFFSELSKQFDRLLEAKEIYTQEYSADTFLMKEYIKEVEKITDYFNNSSFRNLLNNKIKSGEDISNKLLTYFITIINKILKGEYVKDGESERIIYDKKSNGYVSIQNASSGQQEVIRILQDLFIILLEKKDVFRVIEEPEAHLYPLAQKNVIELMATVVNNSESQIVITTHSPYILSVFNNLLYAKKVAGLNNVNKKDVNEIISKFSQLDPNEFRAYSLKNKSKTYIDDNLDYCESIFDKETGMIAQNYLDDVSEELGDDFDRLYNIHAQSL